MTASRLKVRYATALTVAQVLAWVELTALLIPLRHELVPDAATVFGSEHVVAAIVVAVFGIAVACAYAVAVVY